MVAWYDDAEDERKQRKERTDAINTQAEALFNDLWGAVTLEVGQINVRNAQKHLKNPQIFTNGSPFDRVVSVHVMPSPPAEQSKKRELHIKLSASRAQVIASATRLGTIAGVSLTFQLEVGGDGVVHLTHNGNRVATMQDAAVLILRHFLFPDLYP